MLQAFGAVHVSDHQSPSQNVSVVLDKWSNAVLVQSFHHVQHSWNAGSYINSGVRASHVCQNPAWIKNKRQDAVLLQIHRHWLCHHVQRHLTQESITDEALVTWIIITSARRYCNPSCLFVCLLLCSLISSQFTYSHQLQWQTDGVVGGQHCTHLAEVAVEGKEAHGAMSSSAKWLPNPSACCCTRFHDS